MVLISLTALQNLDWKYLIVDEGHRLKNKDCRLLRELKALKADNRLLLSGTPLQNNLTELWSLLHFILPDIFQDLQTFQTWFDFDEQVMTVPLTLPLFTPPLTLLLLLTLTSSCTVKMARRG